MTIATNPTRRHVLAALAAGSLVALTAACGSDEVTAGSGGSGPSIAITSPQDNATVTQPFTLEVRSSEELGETDSGKDHFHLTFDGNSQDYTVETNPKVTIDTLSPGRHTIKVTLQHADHSPVGPESEVTVMVGNAGGGTDTGDSGGYGY